MKRLVAALVFLPTAALAHPGHEAASGGLIAGLAHPLGGLDHLIAMVAVGLWAAVLGGRSLWALPAAFVAAMAAGGLLGASGVAVPGVEPVILASVVVLGAVLAMALRPPLAVSAGLVALFGIAHGAAHGLEGPASGAAAYGAGFLLATMALHLVGIALAFGLGRAGGLVGARVLGGAATAAGLLLVVL